MKVRVLSDLHLEFDRYSQPLLPSIGEDLVVLAGDIGVGIEGIRWAQGAISDRRVAYVLGNHEFYGGDWDELIVVAKEAAAGSNVHVLENDRLDLGDVLVLGCSLWTDFQAMGPTMSRDCRTVAQAEMRDYKQIRRNHRTSKLLTADTIKRCKDSYRWLEQEIAGATKKLLVVTHHAPTLTTKAQWNADLLSNAAFHNSFDELIRPPVAAWIHGHTHHSTRAEVKGILVLSNQRGYPGEGVPFSWDCCVEI